MYPQLKSHLELGKAHGVTKQDTVEIVTQLVFYCGWPKAWSTFPLIREAYGEDDGVDPNRLSCFPAGEKNDAWMLCKKPYIVPIPGTRKLDRMRENAAAAEIILTVSEVQALDNALNDMEMSRVFGGS